MTEESEQSENPPPEEPLDSKAEVPEETITRSLHTASYRRSPAFRVIYANSVRFATAPWDFSLVFGQSIIDMINDVYIEDQVTITLSPQTAKAMAEILNRNLADYEHEFGEIRYTPLPQSAEEPSA